MREQSPNVRGADTVKEPNLGLFRRIEPTRLVLDERAPLYSSRLLVRTRRVAFENSSLMKTRDAD